MLTLYLSLVCTILVVILPVSVFLLHNNTNRLNQRNTHYKIITLCSLMFGLCFVIGSRILTPIIYTEETLASACIEGEYANCTQLRATIHNEKWLSFMLYPIAQNRCMTGHNFVCSHVHTNQPLTDDAVNRWSLYFGILFLFALPSLLVYSWLRILYIQPDPRKRKSKNI